MHRLLRASHRRYVLPVLAILVLVGHGALLYQSASRVRPAGILVSSALILLVLKHLGVFGSVYALLRRRRST